MIYTVRTLVVCLLAIFPALAAAAEPLPSSSRSQLLSDVDRSIDRGVKFLLATQNEDGSFGDTKASPAWRIGETAVTTLALLSCGESHQSKELAKSIAFLRKTKAAGRESTYAVAIRACVWATLPEPVRGPNLKQDLTWLLNACIKQGLTDGFYTYGAIQVGGDLSNSQYGVLGVWYAANAGLEVPTTYWKRVETAWRKAQLPSGAFPYFPYRMIDPRMSMAVAGAATLYITNDYLHADEAHDLLVPATNKPIDHVIQWISDNFSVTTNAGIDTDMRPPREDDPLRGSGVRMRDGTFIYYMLFGYERVGEASGLTRFGQHRWFNEGAQYIVSKQNEDGSWDEEDPLYMGPRVNTAYALLFLSRGRSPVAIQKLQFGNRWNNRPLDASNFVHFMRAASERHVNWQIVNSDATSDELREAPVLYLASDREAQFPKDLSDKLVQYVNEGGCLLVVNEGQSDGFARSMRAWCTDMWPKYKFRDLPKDSPILQNNFPVNGFTDPIEGLSNGVRELVVLIPKGDVSWKFQAGGGSAQVKLSPYAPLANLMLYLHDKTEPREKGESTWIDRDDAKPAPERKAIIARLKYDGNCDPEPLAWARLSNILHNAGVLDLDNAQVPMAPDALRHGFALAHLTATQQFDLKPEERAALKSYIDKGGVLLFDAAGGSNEATLSFEALMATMYPSAKSEPLAIDHEIYSGAFPGGDSSLAIDTFNYRRAAPGRLPQTKLPRLRAYSINNRVAVIESPEDLTAAMTGYTTGGITGYTPATAAALMRNILLWRSAK